MNAGATTEQRSNLVRYELAEQLIFGVLLVGAQAEA
jgi:hypothetical protein